MRGGGAGLGNLLRLFELGDLLGFKLLDEVHLIRPLLLPARQRADGPARPHGAPKGPAALAVCHLPPFASARRRSSRDPPIAALQGSRALPTRGGGCIEGIQEGQPQSFPDRKSTRLNSSHYCAPRMPSD